MKTWIAENQLLAVIIFILIVAGLIYLYNYLTKKSAKKDDGSTTSDPHVINLQDTISNPSGRVGNGLMGISTSAPGGLVHGTAPSGGRVSSGGGGMKH